MKKVLLVYDPESQAHAHSRSLYYRGVYTMVSHDLDDAKDLASYAKYDLVVVDLMDNEEAMAKLIEKFRDSETKVIALATNYSEERAAFYRNLGYHDVIAKPMHTREFMNAVCNRLQVGDETRFSGEFAWGY